MCEVVCECIRTSMNIWQLCAESCSLVCPWQNFCCLSRYVKSVSTTDSSVSKSDSSYSLSHVVSCLWFYGCAYGDFCASGLASEYSKALWPSSVPHLCVETDVHSQWTFTVVSWPGSQDNRRWLFLISMRALLDSSQWKSRHLGDLLPLWTTLASVKNLSPRSHSHWLSQLLERRTDESGRFKSPCCLQLQQCERGSPGQSDLSICFMSESSPLGCSFPISTRSVHNGTMAGPVHSSYLASREGPRTPHFVH